MPVAVPLIIGGLSAAGALGGAAISANAAGNAASQQANSANQALDYTKQVEAPFVNLGSTSAAQLMQDLQSGKFGPGSLPNFTAPTAAEAQATPGYQFTQEQGTLGINRGAAAAGGAFTGGTLKALDKFNTGLADSTYGDTFNRSLATYQSQLAKQSQEYQQLITPLTIGANAASGTSTNVANLMTQVGNAQAAGTVGTANAISGGINGAVQGISTPLLYQYLNQAQGFNNPTNIQNSNNAGASSINSTGLPTGNTYELPPLPPPG